MCELAWLNEDYVRRALLHLNKGLYPFVTLQFERKYGGHWLRRVSPDDLPPVLNGKRNVDTQWLCSIILKYWDTLFEKALGRNLHHLIISLKEIRVRIHHDLSYTPADTRIALGSIARLLRIIDASEQAVEVEKVREVFERQMASIKPVVDVSPVVILAPSTGVKPIEIAKHFLLSIFKTAVHRVAADVYAEAAKQGIKERTLREARRSLGIITQRVGLRKYVWVPPQVVAA